MPFKKKKEEKEIDEIIEASEKGNVKKEKTQESKEVNPILAKVVNEYLFYAEAFDPNDIMNKGTIFPLDE